MTLLSFPFLKSASPHHSVPVLPAAPPSSCKGVFENYTDIDFFDKYILPLYRTLRMVILRIIRLEIESTQKGLLRIMFFLIRKKL